MKRYTLILLIFMFWASAAFAQQAPGAKGGSDTEEMVFEGFVGPTYNWVSQDGSAGAGEYEYLKSSVGGNMHLEYDPLPQRFTMETHYLSQKDYFGEMDYAYHDIVLLNGITRGLFHNLDHFSFGTDDPATNSPSFVDLNPNDQYGLENQLYRASLRLKTPDFPFHLYADSTTVNRYGTIQQRFLSGYTGGLSKVSESRTVDWSSRENRVGLNSHLGPIELDYSHAEKKFTAGGDKVLSDTYQSITVLHNEVPDLKSSVDTFKIHTAYTGRIVASATYADGKRTNEDSQVKSNSHNSAGDITITPFARLVLVLKYRQYDLSQNNPDTVTISGFGNTYAVRDALSSKREVGAGTLRYRLTNRLTVKGEYSIETIERSIGEGTVLSPLQVAPVQTGIGANDWDLAHRTTKTTEKFGLAYRIMNKLSLRADYSAQQVANPAYADDPDRVDAAKTTLTWTPGRKIIAMVGYGGTREKRSYLTSPLAGGSRRTDRDQALTSLTFLVGNRSSITASYMYFARRSAETITFTDAAGMFNLENAVPYGDKGEVFALSASQALSEGIILSADASKSYSSGKFRLNGTVPGTTGIDTLTDLSAIEDIYSAGLEVQFNRNTGSEIRYQHRRYEDKLDTTQNGKVNTALATLYVKW